MKIQNNSNNMRTDKKQTVEAKQSEASQQSPQTTPSFEGQYTPQMFGILPNFKLAKTVPTSVSFKGSVLKKSDFEGCDLAVIEKFKINPQQLKSKEDLQVILYGIAEKFGVKI